jgi:predicted HicB family RNase H-like nuclease
MRIAVCLRYIVPSMKKENKTISLTVRVTPSVKKLVERLAEEDGRSVAGYIERLIVNAATDQRPLERPERPRR